MLLVRDRPEPNEALPGYLLRLSDLNGRKSIDVLLKEYGVAVKPSLFGHSADDKHPYFEAISKMIGFNQTEVAANFQGWLTQKWLFDDRRFIRDVLIKKPRICPKCISHQEPIFDARWSLLPVTHCEEHLKLLLDACPCCGCSFQWAGELFRGCPKCGVRWEAIDSNPPALPSQQSDFLGLLEHQPDLINGWLSELTESVVNTARPFDQYHEPIFEIPKDLSEISSLVLRTYANDRSQELPATGWVKPRRLKLEESINHHVKHDGIADVLGISSGDVLPLVEEGLLKPLTDTPVIRDQLFDVRHANNLISSVKRIQRGAENICVTPELKLLPLFDCSYGQLLAASFESGAISISVQATGLSEFYLLRHELIRVLEQQLNKIDGDFIPQYRVMKILKCTKSELLILVREGKLRMIHSSTRDSICGSSLLEVIREQLPQIKKRSKLIAHF